MLRDYQQRSIDQLYSCMSTKDGNPCLVLPTGAGKSHVVAALCKDALTQWPETRVLMLTHVGELIAQNAEKMRQHWPGAPMGICSASLGRKRLGEPITFAGIQTVRTKADRIGHVDLVIIDECHLVSHKDEGGYRKLIGELTAINPALRVVGLTATPWRLGHGVITEKPGIFDHLVEPVTIEELLFKKHLAPLRSKVTALRYDTSDVGTARGDFKEAELAAAVDTDPQNLAVVDEVIAQAGARKAWLFFCSGVEHARHIAEVLTLRGVPAACVTGDTPKAERKDILARFKAGELRAVTNANVLTTGFDYPDIDLIAMLRPTKSPVLYVQMAGRGLRPKSHTDHCLVLDFAGVVETHGPITRVEPPKKKGKGEAPTKVCKQCKEICHASVKQCPVCGYVFEAAVVEKDLSLRNADIMGDDPDDALEMAVKEWVWRKHTAATSGKEMLAVTYYGADLMAPAVTEYLTVTHDGYAGERAWRTVDRIADNCRASGHVFEDGWLAASLPDVAASLTQAPPPKIVKYIREGKFFRVMARDWNKPP
jgi:DNA repair protein RadD